MPDRSAKDTAKHVAAALFVKCSALSQQESHRADVIADDAVASAALVSVRFAAKRGYFLDKRHKKRTVVVAKFAFYYRRDALKTHTGVDARLWQRG